MDKIVKLVDINQGVLNSLIINDKLEVKANFYNFDRIYNYDNRIKHYRKIYRSKKINYGEFKILVIGYIKYFYNVDFTYSFNKMYKETMKKNKKLGVF